MTLNKQIELMIPKGVKVITRTFTASDLASANLDVDLKLDDPDWKAIIAAPSADDEIGATIDAVSSRDNLDEFIKAQPIVQDNSNFNAIPTGHVWISCNKTPTKPLTFTFVILY